MSPRSDPAEEVSEFGMKARGEESPGKEKSGYWEERWRRAQCD